MSCGNESRPRVNNPSDSDSVDIASETATGTSTTQNNQTSTAETSEPTSETTAQVASDAAAASTTPPKSPERDYTDFGSLRLGDQVIEAGKQTAVTRTFQKTATELLQTIGQPAGDPADSAQVLNAVTILRLHPDGSHVFAFDQSRSQIRSFRISDGKFDQAYGAPGRGEGELLSVTDFDIAPDGSVWVLDTAMRRVTIFESDATLRRTNTFDMTAHSFALFPGVGLQQRYVILSGVNSPQLFHVFSAEGDSLSSFGTFGKKSIMNLGMLGALVQTSRGFALIPWYAGRVAAFDSKSKLEFYRSTFYPTPPPRLGAPGSGRTLEEIEGPVRSRAPVVTHVTDNVMFVAAYQRDSEPTLVDAYDLRSGDYEYSIRNPDSTGSCVVWGVTNSSIFSICPAIGTIQQWKRDR